MNAYTAVHQGCWRNGRHRDDVNVITNFHRMEFLRPNRLVIYSSKLNTGSTSASSTAQHTLSTYMASAQFVTDLKDEGGG